MRSAISCIYCSADIAIMDLRLGVYRPCDVSANRRDSGYGSLGIDMISVRPLPFRSIEDENRS
jgi:hypothetical protein